MHYDVKDINLADKGRLRVEWAQRDMPVLNAIRERFERGKPLAGLRIAACLHVTTETGVLAATLKAGGATVHVCASNPLSTQDDVAAYLAKHEGIPTFAIKGEDGDTYYRHIDQALDVKPQMTMDDGADLVFTVHTKRQDLLGEVFAGTEETTTGVIRLKAMAKDGVLRFPIIAVNDAMTKYLFDNRYGTGQSTIDGILRSTNALLAGATFVVAGYGWCGRGLAHRARGLGAQVVVTEVDPLKAIEAVMDGFRVMPMDDAAPLGDVFVTVTGDIRVLTARHFERMKDGAVIANSGHFDVEVDKDALRAMAERVVSPRPGVETFVVGGRRLNLLGDGRLVNLACAEGHPATVMDMSFANQALCCEYLATLKRRLTPGVYEVPEEIDGAVAKLKLAAMGISIDALTPEQAEYLASWRIGT